MERRQRAGHPSRIEVTGPLAPYADGFREDLASKGFDPHSVSGQMRLMADLSGWMEGQGHSGDALAGGGAGEYMPARRAAGRRGRGSARGVRPVVGDVPTLRGEPAAP